MTDTPVRLAQVGTPDDSVVWRHAAQRLRGGLFTVAVDTMTFYLPVFVGDVVCCYTSILKKGRTSISVNIQTWALRSETMERVLVTEGTYTYVSIGSDRKPRPMSE